MKMKKVVLGLIGAFRVGLDDPIHSASRLRSGGKSEERSLINGKKAALRCLSE
jgi:hypothetical protein